MTTELLKVSNIYKSFSGVKALQDVSLTIEPGKVYCLVGENGSGKSTLIKIIAGVYPQDEGEIVINGKVYKHLHPIDAIREGIQVIYQDFSLFPNLTVAENIALNDQLARNKRLVNWQEIRRVAQEALQKINISLDLDARVEQMSVANKQLIAISKALLQNARLIIMDEPTTALTEREIKSLFAVIRKLQQEDNISFLFVSHKLNEVQEISESIMVLRNGKKVIEGEAGEFDTTKLVYYMTGRQVDESYYNYTPPANPQPLLKVDGLTLAGSFFDISFDLLPGEILGITGLLGSGRTELALALFGLHPAGGGNIYIKGVKARLTTIQDAIKYGIGYVPEDRLTEGLFLEQSIGRNVVVRTIDTLLGKAGLIDAAQLNNQISQWVNQLSIKTASPDLPVKTLSGGNQQRVVLAKWLASSPQILILNGPTVGVDVGSKSELHETMKNLARQGMSLIVISDDIPELMQTCNRILLMRRGRIVEEFNRQTITENELTAKLTEAQ
jgi:simple sugar transport system ATP-binding protein